MPDRTLPVCIRGLRLHSVGSSSIQKKARKIMSPKQKNKLKILAEWMKSLAYSMMTFSLRTEDSVYSKSQSGQV